MILHTAYGIPDIRSGAGWLTRESPPQVIGGGVVGLAIARRLARKEGTRTVLLERHQAVGTETSSRNSEVHPGPRIGSDLHLRANLVNGNTG